MDTATRLRAESTDAYRGQVQRRGVEGRFLATLSYMITLVLVRGFTFLSYELGIGPHLEIGGAHIHHMVPGLALLLIAGFLSLDARAA